MAEHLLDAHEVHAAHDRVAGAGVPQIMKPNVTLDSGLLQGDLIDAPDIFQRTTLSVMENMI